MQTMSREGNRLVHRWDGETLVVEPWGNNSFRVRSAMMGDPEDTDYALLPPAQTEVFLDIGTGKSEIRNGRLRAVMEREGGAREEGGPVCLSFYDRKVRLLLQEEGKGGALNRRSRWFKPVIGGDYELTVTFASQAEEKLYGMGQYQQDFLNIKNCSLELAQRNSQASVPFVLSSLGYGFLWHNPAVGRVSFCANTTQWQAQSTRQMDYWITAGDTPDEIECAYAAATGTVPQMPEYGLGFWQCKLRYWNQEQLLQVAREYRRREIPLDVIVCDFFHWPRMGDFRFDEAFFPDPEGMVRALKEMGVELMVSVWPEVAWTSENYEEMKQKGYLVKAEKGIDLAKLFNENSTFTDVTNPQARDYLWEKCRKNYYEKGIRLFWLDEAEPEYGPYDYDLFRYQAGPALEVSNYYPVLYAKTFWDGMTACGQKKIMNLIRCAWAGSQKYGTLVWSGDVHSSFRALREQVQAGISMGIAGIAWWATDIGGFLGGCPDDKTFRELLVRWFQWAVFTPVLRMHGARQPFEKLEEEFRDEVKQFTTGQPNEIYSYGEEIFDILMKYVRLRKLLAGYLTDLMEETHETGMPLMRALFLEYPEDPESWNVEDEYLFGKDILVAPVMEEGQRERVVYFPVGDKWTAAFGAAEYHGGTCASVDAPLDKIPVFIRNGSRVDFKQIFNQASAPAALGVRK